MIENAQPQLADDTVGLLDEAYLAWFTAENDAERALHAWFVAARGHRAIAYQAYREALEREDAAARHLQHLAATSEPGLAPVATATGR
jgi:tRNA A37 threonylcarbamoyltransferase TsaD